MTCTIDVGAIADAGPGAPRTLAATERAQIQAISNQTSWRLVGLDDAAHLVGLKPAIFKSRIKEICLRRSR
jgi:hypothetical protein